MFFAYERYRSCLDAVMIDEPVHALGLSGDHGWNDQEDSASMRGLAPLALMLGHGAYWLSLWLLAGLFPLPLIAVRRRRANRSNGQS
jgi:hypothetical protein